MSRASEVQSNIQHLRSLDAVFQWAIRQIPRFLPEDVVIQDEYTHDVLFRAPDGSYLVFDTT